MTWLEWLVALDGVEVVVVVVVVVVIGLMVFFLRRDQVEDWVSGGSGHEECYALLQYSVPEIWVVLYDKQMICRLIVSVV